MEISSLSSRYYHGDMTKVLLILELHVYWNYCKDVKKDLKSKSNVTINYNKDVSRIFTNEYISKSTVWDGFCHIILHKVVILFFVALLFFLSFYTFSHIYGPVVCQYWRSWNNHVLMLRITKIWYVWCSTNNNSLTFVEILFVLRNI